MASLFSTCLFAVKDGRDYKMAQLHKVPTKKSAFDSDYKINAQKRMLNRLYEGHRNSPTHMSLLTAGVLTVAVLSMAAIPPADAGLMSSIENYSECVQQCRTAYQICRQQNRFCEPGFLDKCDNDCEQKYHLLSRFGNGF